MKIFANKLESSIELSKPDFEGWMKAKVYIKVPCFEGAFDCTVEINEFKEFVEVLRDLKNAIGSEFKSSWRNMEENIEFQFHLKQLGSIEGEYRFSSNNFSLGPSLSGEFEADQSYIEGWLKDAELVLNTPMVHTPMGSGLYKMLHVC